MTGTVTSPTATSTAAPTKRRLLRTTTSIALLAAMAFGIAQVGVDVALRVAGLSALAAVGIAAAAVAAAALAVRRRLSELVHLPDLGRSCTTTHEDGRVVGLRRAGSGDVLLDLMSASRRTVVLDENGMPDRVTSAGAGTSTWRLRGSSSVTPEDLLRLDALLTLGTPVRVTSQEVVTLTGPVVAEWQLEAQNGLVVRSR